MRLPIGAEPGPGGTRVRLWAPRAREVSAVVEGSRRPHPLRREPGGYFSGLLRGVKAGALYRYLLDGRGPFPDPASRFQPHGPHGPSQVVDPASYRWRSPWAGIGTGPHAIYEMHIGTFTNEGTFAAADVRRLAELGITLVEVMPVSDFPGRFGWGYDGVNWFAPSRLYGSPDDFRAFVDRAHAAGLGVLLDVVYNHLGPDGNYLGQFAPEYFDPDLMTEWGPAIDYRRRAVREFAAANARCWIEEFHLDGLRLDATQSIHPRETVASIARAARKAAGKRRIFLVAENERQEVRLLTEYGIDAVWNDDFHHSAFVALSGARDAYYSDHAGAPQEFVSAAQWGCLFQGQYYGWQRSPRGEPALDLPGSAFVHFLENHDQIANTGFGRRAHQRSSPGRLRALTALLLLGPQTPMVFQGQEYQADTPFLYFADHVEGLSRLVTQGRRESLRQFASLASPDAQERLPDPSRLDTFLACKLQPPRREEQFAALRLHRDLIRLRKSGRGGPVRGAVLGPSAFLVRIGDRLILVNLGATLRLVSCPEPLLAPPLGRRWRRIWSSDDPEYGGPGTVEPVATDGFVLAGECASVLEP